MNNCNDNSPHSVIEINNPESLVLFHKIVIPSALGDETQTPPYPGKYCNVLAVYETNGHSYLYSSDGIPTALGFSSGGVLVVDEFPEVEQAAQGFLYIQRETGESRVTTDGENWVITGGDSSKSVLLVEDFPSVEDAEPGVLYISSTSSEAVITGDNENWISISGGGGTNDFNILFNRPKYAGQVMTSATDIPDFSSQITSLSSSLSSEVLARQHGDAELGLRIDEASDAISTEAQTRQNADLALQTSIDAIDDAINKVVMVDLSLDSNPSTTTIRLDADKQNIKTGETSSKNIPLPVASATQAGIMNSATFNAVEQHTEDIEAIMNGAVAIDNLAAGVTQAQITSAWKTTTGQTDLINHASVYDIANNRVWTYYTNTSTWYATTNTSQVTIDRFTNTSEGTIKGSTNVGQVFAESDGTGSVNGWDALSSAVDANTSKLATIAQGAEVNQNAFSNVKVGSTTVAADSKTDTLELVAGDNITLTPDAANDKVTIAGKNMIYTKTNLSPAEDTTAAWASLFGDKTATGVDITSGNYFITYYYESGRFANQPYQYGFLETILSSNGTNIYQRWHTQSNGPIMYRSGNQNGWAGPSTGEWNTVGTAAQINNTDWNTLWQ